MNSVQQAAARSILTSLASFTKLSFTELTGAAAETAQLRFGMSDLPETAYAYFPGGSAKSGDSWYNNSGGAYDNPVRGNYAWFTFAHEIGHTLGLEHPHESDPPMPADGDHLSYTVMSYRSYEGAKIGYAPHNAFPQSYMTFDIAALQQLYGANFNHQAGDTTYQWNQSTGEMSINGIVQSGLANFSSVWDGGGIDTYDFSNMNSAIGWIDLRPGEWVYLNGWQRAHLYGGTAPGQIANALLYKGDERSLIENAIGTAGNDFMYGNVANNHLTGKDGSDELLGYDGDDHLDGGEGSDKLFGHLGNDILEGGGGYDELRGFVGDDLLYGGDASDQIYGDDGQDRLWGGNSDDNLHGGAGDDELRGDAGFDTLWGDGGNDKLYGGEGQDTAMFSSTRSAHSIYAFNGRVVVLNTANETDWLEEIETLRFSDVAVASNSIGNFRALDYIASHVDLALGLGADADAGFRHFIEYGYFEGRIQDQFDELLYGAVNPDLALGLGANREALLTHFIKYGVREGRLTSGFDPLIYGAVNRDLALTVGADREALLKHYLTYGVAEGRAFSGFDPLLYGAVNRDLALGLGADRKALLEHYLNYGVREGRATEGFDPLLYGAVNRDLALGLGADREALLKHYLDFGLREGRPTEGFNPLLYGASNRDLALGLGADREALLEHYLAYGLREGRATEGFEPVSYLLNNSDLAGADAGAALRHYLNYGIHEGRTTTGDFGTEQIDHALSAGAAALDEITAGDRDWFQFAALSGRDIRLEVTGSGGNIGTLADPFLIIYDEFGRLLAWDNDSGPGNDARLEFHVPEDGTYYAVVQSAAPAASGTYYASFDYLI